MGRLIEISSLRNRKSNKIEEVKKTGDVTDTLKRIEDYRSYEDVSDADKNFFLKNFGIFNKENDNFMIRVRIPFGVLNKEQARAIGEAAKEYAKAIQSVFLFNTEWIGALPGKFNTGFNGATENRCNIYGQDLAFVAAKKEESPGFNIYWGGKVGQIAFPSGVFVDTVEDSRAFFTALAEIYKEYGFRDNRNKNRFYFFIQEIGNDELVGEIEKAAGKKFKSFGETLIEGKTDFIAENRVDLQEGKTALKLTVPSGLFNGEDLIAAAGLAKKYGSEELRFDVNQNLHIIVHEEKAEKILKEALFQKYNSDNPFLNGTVACAGEKECKFGVIENKPDAIKLAQDLYEKFPDYDKNIRLFWSGCPKGCGVHGFGDIGFEGTKTKVDGKSVPAVNIYKGGSLKEAKEGEKILSFVPLCDLFEKVVPLL